MYIMSCEIILLKQFWKYRLFCSSLTSAQTIGFLKSEMLKLIVNQINGVNKCNTYFVWKHTTEFCENVTVNALVGALGIQVIH